jgi:hypothetical protein
MLGFHILRTSNLPDGILSNQRRSEWVLSEVYNLKNFMYAFQLYDCFICLSKYGIKIIFQKTGACQMTMLLTATGCSVVFPS